MKVLSLFDGISCGYAALERAGFSAEKYAAFEIDKFAVMTSAKNYPGIIRFGNVFEGDFTQFRGYDLLIGGSPCTYWSIARKGRETTPDGEGFKLFMQYVRALKESGCRWFLYENNHSIHSDIKAEISRQLGTEPIMINSALVSAQQRKRCYWTNIPGITQPADKGILLRDIVDNAVPWQVKSYCLTANYAGASLKNTLERHQRTMVAVPIMRITEGTKQGFVDIMPGECVDLSYSNSKTRRGRAMKEKSNCLTTSCEFYQYCGTTDMPIYKVVNDFTEIAGNLYPIKIKDGCYIIRKLSPVECERLQTLPDNYTAGVSDAQRNKQLGNGWTVDVIAHILSFLPH